MANIINADDGSVSGIAGIKQTADSSGALVFQANGVNAISISNTAVVTVASSISGNGAGLTDINASNISSGTVATARLASGTANSSTYLRGDQTWSTVNSSQWTTTGSDIYYNTGNVGIGTSSPTNYANYKTLTIASSTVDQGGVLRVQNSNATIIGLSYVDNNAYVIKSVTSTPILFGTTDTERMRIDTSGNVGIGTSSPGVKLDVNGSGQFTSDANGTSTPLKLINNATTGTVVAKLGFQNGGVVKASINAAVYNNDFMTFNTASDTERMRIDASGNLLVGTTSAINTGLNLNNSSNYFGVRLAVSGSIQGQLIQEATGNIYLDAGTTNTSGSLIFRTNNGTERMRIASNGALGIGGANYGSSGQVLTSNGSGSAPSWQNASGQGGRGQVFTSSGTFTIPTGITSLKVTVVGGGGGGGGSSSSNNYQAGAGGGAGGAGISYLTGLTSGNTISVTIGAGGSAGAGGNNIGGTGGSTSVSSGTQSITTITATGGGGGASTEYSNAQNWGNTKGGNGGSCSGATMNFGGNPGQNTYNGGGNDGQQHVSGGGGGSIFGGGGSARVSNQGNGIAGQAPGAGGSGASFQNSSFSGGAGAAGAVIFEW